MSNPQCPVVHSVSHITDASVPGRHHDEAALAVYRPTTFSSQVHADETSRLPDQPSSPSTAGTQAEELAKTFRHGGWEVRRRRTLEALKSLDVPPGRIERFCRCGCASWVLRSQAGPTRFKLASNRCRDRFCVPCSVEHQRLVSSNIIAALEGRHLRFMTLTLRSTDSPLTDVLTRLYKCFARLRRDKAIQGCMTGGMYFLEITLGSQTEQWHPHLHILYEGTYIPLKVLTDTWHVVTGDSFIVDIRALKDSRSAAGYVAKYASKAIGSNIVFNPEKFAEVIVGLVGRRVFSCFGDWRKMDLSKAHDDGSVWVCIGHLGHIIMDAQRGVPAAMAILRQLRGSNVEHPITLFDHPP